MTRDWNLAPGTDPNLIDGNPCQFCGSNLGCDCDDETESNGLTYREKIEYEKNND